MMGQKPLETHDGRPGNRGAIVNVASNLALVSRAATRTPTTTHPAQGRDKRLTNTPSQLLIVPPTPRSLA